MTCQSSLDFKELMVKQSTHFQFLSYLDLRLWVFCIYKTLIQKDLLDCLLPFLDQIVNMGKLAKL